MPKRAQPYLTEENIERVTAQWLEEIRSLVPPRPQLELNLDKSALLLIDLQNYFCSAGGRAYLPAFEPVSKRILNLLQIWRRGERPIFFTRHCHRTGSDRGMLGKFFRDYIDCGEWGAQLAPDFSPREGEFLIEKDTYDPFWKTDLEEKLRSLGVEQLLITGVVAQLCCETTARSAFIRGFEVYLAVDGVASSRAEFHRSSLLSLASGFAILYKASEIEDMVRDQIGNL